MTQSYAPTRQMHSLQFTLTSPLGAIWRFSSIRPFPCMLLQFMVCNFAHLSSALAAPIIQELQVVSSSPLGVNSDQETCRIISSKHRPILSALSLSLSLCADSTWKITTLEEKLHGSCDCFSNFLAGWCVCSDDVSFTFMIHENLWW